MLDLFTNADVQAVMRAAEELFTPLRGATMKTLVGMLVVIGMRIGEALRLNHRRSQLGPAVLAVAERLRTHGLNADGDIRGLSDSPPR
jgi:hypothetical protein